MEALTIEEFNALLADTQASDDNEMIEALRKLTEITEPQTVAADIGEETGWMLWV